MKFESAQKQLLTKVILFLGLFVVASGIIGSWLIPTRLLMSFGFYIYGNFGKMVIISAVIFAFIAKDKLSSISSGKWTISYLPYLIFALIFEGSFFVLGKMLLEYPSATSNLPLTVISHLVVIAIPLMLFLGIFGPAFLFRFVKRFIKEILTCAILSVVFVIGIFNFWNLWPYFSRGVLESVKFLLSFTFSKVEHILPITLVVNDFAVSVAKACSGLDSLFMFIALFTLIGLVDYKKIDFVKYFIFFPIGMLGTYLVNILRVYLLIVVGVTISPELALTLFHTYAGMIMFIIYFAIFLKIVYKKILKN